MINKQIQPETFDFGMPAVDIVEAGRKGLDKTAMLKRAGAFDDILAELLPKPNRTYLHVITTGASEVYGANRNADAWPENPQDIELPHPEKPGLKVIHITNGLKQNHDKSYMDGGAVYQEHHVKDTEPSGEVVAAKYNDDMHRGELIIAVDTDKWAPRLERKAKGQDIYLSIGASVPRDLCAVCGREAHVESEHCDHFKHHRMQLLDDGSRCFVYNDDPKFYDISGVDVPADRIAFVLRKVASGAQVKTAALDAYATLGARKPMPFVKAASVLRKLSTMEKQIEGMIEGDQLASDTEDVFVDDPKVQKEFILRVENYPTDEVIDSCNRKGLLLSPGMLFKLLGNECDSEDLMACDDSCCGDCSAMLRELEDDEELRDSELLDGSFDQHFPVDLSLDSILNSFLPELGMKNHDVGKRSVRIIIIGAPKIVKLEKSASLRKRAEDALRRTYARYFISFAERNDDATCMNALRKVANYGKLIKS